MITVRDVMCEDVIVVSPDTSVREIAQTLVREAIGGVPVVESDGTILGVVSASDIVRVAAREPEVELGFAPRRSPALRFGDGDDVVQAPSFYAPEVIPEWVRPVLLGDALDELDATAIMTPASFYVGPDVSIEEFADFLVRGRIHRALVLDKGTLIGIASSFDALRALARGGPQGEESP